MKQTATTPIPCKDSSLPAVNQGDSKQPQSITNSTTALLLQMIQALVDAPQEVTVDTVKGTQSVIFEVRVGREDVRRIIGRKGRTAAAIRELLFNLGAKVGQRYLLEIVEPEKG